MSLVTEFDHSMMLRALRLAKCGLNTTTPNPRVGCVLVNSNKDIIGEGFHVRAGEPHAEINALNDAGDCAFGATAYVTLEPCSHIGKTGACSEALIKAGISRVVYGMEDPNPLVSGAGLKKLADQGIEVVGPVQEDAARALNPGFIKRMTEGMPYVRVKSAMSLDGRTAMASGESKWITGPKARTDVQNWRARSCAIITGVDSVINDNPALTVRLSEEDRQPLRVVMDSNGRSPKSAEVFSGAGHTVLATVSEKAVVRSGEDYDECWVLPARDGRVDPYAVVKKLADLGCNEVLVETGATLAGAFVRLGLVDEFIIYMAPKLLGSRARPLFEIPVTTMSGQLPLLVKDIVKVGDDFRFIAIPDPES